jgi:multiple sugar transport system permease protein
MTRINKILAYIALICLSIPPMLPLVWMISTSLKTNEQIYMKGEGAATKGFSFASLIPSPVAWNNYPDSLETIPFMVYLKNTVFLCLCIVIASVISSAIVAYGFARINFKGSKMWFGIMLATMALPGQVTMIPNFALFRALGWYGTYLPLIVPAFCATPFYVFLLSQFFKTLPDEMAESAKVDGANEWVIFCRLIIPLSKPALATCALFAFLGTWNDFLGPLLYLSDSSKYTLAYGLQQFVNNPYVNWMQLMAASTLFTLPIILLFFFAQNTFIQGISTTGGK